MKTYLLIFLWIIQIADVNAGNWLNEMINAKGSKPKVHAKVTPSFFDNHEIIFFYASSCPHCHELAPILKEFTDTNGIKVLPLSFDSKALNEFPTFKLATSAWVNSAYRGQAITYPALFILNTNTHNLYPISIGSLSYDELEKRMSTLIPKIISFERVQP